MAIFEWSTLPDDVKRYVIGYLYYSDKQSLARCSKSDRELVRTSVWIFDRFDFTVNRDSKCAIEVEHRYRQDIFTKEDENHTLVEKYYRLEDPRWRLVSSKLFENRNFQEMAIGRLNEMFKAQRWTVEELYMDLHSTPPTFLHPISVKTAQIQAVIRPISNPTLMFEMVKSIEPTVDWLQFRIDRELPRGLEEKEAVQRAERLVFSSKSSVNDEDLLKFDAHFLDVFESRCTKRGVRQFILKRLSTGKPCHFNIGLSDEDVDVGVVTEGFQVKQAKGKINISLLGFSFFCSIETLDTNRVGGSIEKIYD